MRFYVFSRASAKFAAVSKNMSVDIIDPKLRSCFFSLAKWMVVHAKCHFYHCSLCIIKWWIALFSLSKSSVLVSSLLHLLRKSWALYGPVPFSFVVRLTLILQNDPSVYLFFKKIWLCYAVARLWSYSWSSFRISVINILSGDLDLSCFTQHYSRS